MKLPAWKQLALLLLIALAIRLGVAVWWQARHQGAFVFGDSHGYWTLAERISEGQPYRYGEVPYAVFRTPGYPLLLAPIVWLDSGTRGIMLARAQSAVFGTAAVAGVWWLARLLFDGTSALIAAAMATFYPGAIAVSALVLTEAPVCALMLVQLAFCVLAWKATTWRAAGGWAAAAGLTAAAATLVRPSWMLFTPLAVVVGLLMRQRGAALGSDDVQAVRKTRDISHGEVGASRASGQCTGKTRVAPDGSTPFKFRFGIATLMLVGLVVGMTPWWIRNAVVTGCFVPTTLQVGASLYDGLNPQATGASDMRFVARFAEEERRRQAQGPPPEQSLEVRLDRRLRREALAFARANPGRAMQLGGVKFLRIWNIWPNEPQFRRWPVRLAIVGTYVPVLVLGLVGGIRTIRRGWPYILCWLPAVYFTALHVVFIGSIRYRQPAMLGLIVLAAGVVGSWKILGSARQTMEGSVPSSSVS